MIETLKYSDYETMPWKNGLGVTAQIDIYPPQAIFPEDFLWRISSAIVKTSAPFSEFPNCDRFLTVLQGDGLMLNDQKLGLNDIIRFAGEAPVFGKLISSEVVDLGIIFRRDFIDCSMTQIVVPAGLSKEYKMDHDVNYLFCADGTFSVMQKKIEKGDCLKVSKVTNIEITAGPKSDTRLFSIQISMKEKTSL